MDTTYLGIVLSGSRLMIGEVNTAGDILQHKAYKLSFFNQESALDIIHTSMEDYVRSASLAERKPAAIGVGLIGRVNADEGMWYQIDFVKLCTQLLPPILRSRFLVSCAD